MGFITPVNYIQQFFSEPLRFDVISICVLLFVAYLLHYLSFIRDIITLVLRHYTSESFIWKPIKYLFQYSIFRRTNKQAGITEMNMVALEKYEKQNLHFFTSSQFSEIMLKKIHEQYT